MTSDELIEKLPPPPPPKRGAVWVANGCAAVLLLTLLCGFGGFYLLTSGAMSGERRIADLMAGRQDVHLRHITWDVGTRRVECSHPEVLRYFEEQLRKPCDHIDEGTWQAELTLVFKDGESQRWQSQWGGHGFRLVHPSDWEYHPTQFRYAKPFPPKVEEAISFLEGYSPTHRGRLLIMTAEGTQVEE